MPLSLIQTILGLSFVMIWVFIGTMILRDRQLAIRGEQDSQEIKKPAARRAPAPHPGKKAAMPGERTHRRRGASAA